MQGHRAASGSKWDRLRSAVDREAFGDVKKAGKEAEESEKEAEIEEGVRKFWPKAKIVLKYFAPAVAAAAAAAAAGEGTTGE